MRKLWHDRTKNFAKLFPIKNYIKKQPLKSLEMVLKEYSK